MKIGQAFGPISTVEINPKSESNSTQYHSYIGAVFVLHDPDSECRYFPKICRMHPPPSPGFLWQAKFDEETWWLAIVTKSVFSAFWICIALYLFEHVRIVTIESFCWWLFQTVERSSHETERYKSLKYGIQCQNMIIEHLQVKYNWQCISKTLKTTVLITIASHQVCSSNSELSQDNVQVVSCNVQSESVKHSTSWIQHSHKVWYQTVFRIFSFCNNRHYH